MQTRHEDKSVKLDPRLQAEVDRRTAWTSLTPAEQNEVGLAVARRMEALARHPRSAEMAALAAPTQAEAKAIAAAQVEFDARLADREAARAAVMRAEAEHRRLDGDAGPWGPESAADREAASRGAIRAGERLRDASYAFDRACVAYDTAAGTLARVTGEADRRGGARQRAAMYGAK